MNTGGLLRAIRRREAKKRFEVIICTGRFRQRFASAVGNRALNPRTDAYLLLPYNQFKFHELRFISLICQLKVNYKHGPRQER